MPGPVSSTHQERDLPAFLSYTAQVNEGLHTLAQNDLLALPQSRDDLSTVITDQAGLEPDLLLVTGCINDGHRALVTTLADG